MYLLKTRDALAVFPSLYELQIIESFYKNGV